MSHEPEEDPRLELYSRFIADLESNDRRPYYEEDELVELFDFAGDRDDAKVRCEVLFAAARLYPESVPLRMRRAIYYFENGMDSAARNIMDTLPENMFLRHVLALRLDSVNIDSDTGAERMDMLMQHAPEKFTDEDVIQLVNAAEEIGAHDWLKAHREQIRYHCDYLPSFLYEYAEAMMEAERYADAAEALDELTLLEPFNIDYWDFLAQAYGADGKYDQALQAAEYSMAINPDGARARLNRAHALYSLKGADAADEIKELLTDSIYDDPANSRGVQLLASALSAGGRNTEALELLRNFSRINPTDRDVIDGRLFLGDPEVSDALYILLDVSPELTEKDWTDWAKKHLSEPYNYNASAFCAILDCWYQRANRIGEGLPRLFEGLYSLGRYEDVIDRFNNYKKAISADPSVLERPHPQLMFLTVVLAELRLKRRGARERVAAMIEDEFGKPMTVANMDARMTAVGYREKIVEVYHLVKSPGRITTARLDLVDPFPPAR